MSNLRELNAEDFAEATSKGVSLVDFWAPWCGPCKMMLPILEEIAAEIGTTAMVAKVNVDNNQSLAAQFGVRTIPALFVIKDGQIVEQFIGLQDKKKLITAIKNA